jgi:phosphoglycolate phosphatase
MAGKFQNILFDLDGTLTDPKEGIVNSVLYSINKMGIEEKEPGALRLFIGPPLLDSFRLRYSLSDHDAGRAVKYYREYFSEKGIYENEIYPEIVDLLIGLVSQERKLFVATLKPTVFAERILSYFKIGTYFKDLIGSNLDNTRMDKAEIISILMVDHKLEKERSVMIGDRKHDIIGAKKCGLRSIGVTYGFGSIEELQVENPDFIAYSCTDIHSILALE